jgi:hypothetical protein
MPRRTGLRLAAVAVLVLVVTGCGEPGTDLDVPPRAQSQQVLDEVGVLAGSDLDIRLAELAADGHDVVALAFESPEATLGHADRSARRLLEAWEADVVLVAVARPGDFTSDDEQRRRFFGVVPRDRFLVSGDTRERIAEELAPPLAAANDWPQVFTVALDEVEAELRAGEDGEA